MKKIILLILFISSIILTSCKKEVVTCPAYHHKDHEKTVRDGRLPNNNTLRGTW